MLLRNLTAGMLAGLLLIAGPGALAEPIPPTKAVESVVEKVLALLGDESLTPEVRRASLREVIAPGFDFESMSRSILAAAWKDATPEEQQRFLTLFQKLLENTYIAAMEDYSGQKVRYGKEKLQGNLASVETFIVRTNSVETPVVYRLRNRDDRWFAYDVTVEGVSLVNNYRGSFRSIVRKDGMSGLIEQLDRKFKQEG